MYQQLLPWPWQLWGTTKLCTPHTHQLSPCSPHRRPYFHIRGHCAARVSLQHTSPPAQPRKAEEVRLPCTGAWHCAQVGMSGCTRSEP